jgi:hypothetical protein
VLQGGVHNIVHLNAVVPSADGLLLSFGRVLAPREVRRRALKARAGRIAARLGLTRPYPTRPSAVPASTVPHSAYGVVLLRPDRSAELLLHVTGVSVPNHNLDENGELLVYGDSNGGRLVAWDTRAQSERSAVRIPGDPSFVRGLARLEDGTYLVGSQSPLAVHAVDLTRGELTGSLTLDGEPNESVYGICPVPEHFVEVPGTVFGAAPAAAGARGVA